MSRPTTPGGTFGPPVPGGDTLEQFIIEVGDARYPTDQELATALATKAEVSAVDTALALKAEASAVATSLAAKADASYTPDGTGAVSRTIVSKLKEQPVSVKDFGAVGDGTTDDTAAIQAAFNRATALGRNARPAIYFPKGRYYITAPITFTDHRWAIYGDGMDNTTVVLKSNIEAFKIDVLNKTLFGEFKDIGISYEGGAAATSATGIYFYNSGAVNSNSGAEYWVFNRVRLSNLFYGIRFTDQIYMGLWNGTNSIANYGQLQFLDLSIVSASIAGLTATNGVWFDAGPGAHNTYRGGVWGCTNVGLRMGSGGSLNGVGDQIIDSVHFINMARGVQILGPTTAGVYNENISIANCQFDGITDATVYMERMKNFRITPGNSTSAATYRFVDCIGYRVADTRAYDSAYGVADKTVALGTAQTADLFEISRAPSTATYRSVYVEVLLDILGSGQGAAAVHWRGFVQFQAAGANPGVSQIAQDKYGTNTANISLTIAAVDATKAKATVTITNASGTNTVRTQVKILGESYTFKAL